MHWPDIDENDTRWESRLLRFMSPPEQTADGRGRIYFSLFHVVTQVFALLNVIVYWTIQVPNGRGHLPSPGDGGGDGGGDDGEGNAAHVFVVYGDGASKNPFKEVYPQGWFPIYCLFNLYVFPALEVVIESIVLNSMRRPEVGHGSPGFLPPESLTFAAARSDPSVYQHRIRCTISSLRYDWRKTDRPQCLLLAGRIHRW